MENIFLTHVMENIFVDISEPRQKLFHEKNFTKHLIKHRDFKRDKERESFEKVFIRLLWSETISETENFNGNTWNKNVEQNND